MSAAKWCWESYGAVVPLHLATDKVWRRGQSGDTADTWRTKFGGAATADRRLRFGGHMAGGKVQLFRTTVPL